MDIEKFLNILLTGREGQAGEGEITSARVVFHPSLRGKSLDLVSTAPTRFGPYPGVGLGARDEGPRPIESGSGRVDETGLDPLTPLWSLGAFWVTGLRFPSPRPPSKGTSVS